MRYLDTGVYNRLFTKILDSSIWLEPTPTRIVWITLLAAMDEDGYAHFSAIENLASRARVTTEEAQKAVDCFLAPDPHSENTEHEGRRVERVPGGFFVLNAEHHRKILNREIRREQTRLRVEKCRRNKKSVTSALQGVTPASASDVTKDEECEGKSKTRGTQKEVEEFSISLGLPRSDGEYCFHNWESNGWTINGKPIKCWRSAIRKWKIGKFLPSQKPQQKSFFQKEGPAPPRKIDKEWQEEKLKRGL